MPANKYTRALYKTGTVASERAAIANRDPARKAAAEKIMKREGSTNPSGGRQAAKGLGAVSNKERQMLKSAAKMPAKVSMPKAPQIIRTTTNMKPTPTGKKR